MAEQGVLMLDVREPDEWASGHMPGHPRPARRARCERDRTTSRRRRVPLGRRSSAVWAAEAPSSPCRRWSTWSGRRLRTPPPAAWCSSASPPLFRRRSSSFSSRARQVGDRLRLQRGRPARDLAWQLPEPPRRREPPPAWLLGPDGPGRRRDGRRPVAPIEARTGRQTPASPSTRTAAATRRARTSGSARGARARMHQARDALRASPSLWPWWPWRSEWAS